MPGSDANRRLPLACLLIGLSSLGFVGAIAVYHTVFAMPLRDKSSGVALAPLAVRTGLLIMALLSGAVAAFGAALMTLQGRK